MLWPGLLLNAWLVFYLVRISRSRNLILAPSHCQTFAIYLASAPLDIVDADRRSHSLYRVDKRLLEWVATRVVCLSELHSSYDVAGYGR